MSREALQEKEQHDDDTAAARDVNHRDATETSDVPLGRTTTADDAEALAPSKKEKNESPEKTTTKGWDFTLDVRSDLVFGIVLFVVAFALRFAVAQWLAGEPVWDGHYYDFGARRIAEGHGYSDDRVIGGVTEWHPWCHYPVGYSAYLAAFYWVFGAHAWTAHLANALTGALTAVVVFLLAGETVATRSAAGALATTSMRARFAGVLTALHPGLVLYGALVMGEVLSALTVMCAFWVAIRLTRVLGEARASHATASDGTNVKLWAMRGYGGVVAGAFVLGLGALVRPQALLCAPFLALVIPRSFWMVRAKAAIVACVIALVPILPWTARNCAVMDGCALVSTNAGWNLAIGSFPRATGRFETLRSSDGCREVTGQVQQDRCWLEYGIANIKSEPGRWMGLIPAKLANTFDHESFAVEYLREARPTEWPEPRRVAWRTVITSLHRVLIVAAPLAFIALILPRRRRRVEKPSDRDAIYRDAGPPDAPDVLVVIDSKSEKRERLTQGILLGLVLLATFVAISSKAPTFWPIVIATCVLAWLPLPGRPAPLPGLSLVTVLIATTALTHAVFFGDDRYHVVMTPALCLLLAAALREKQKKTSERQNTHGADTPPGMRAAETSSSQDTPRF